MSLLPKSFERLAAAFERLPGIGAKGAARIAYHLLRAPREEAAALAEAVVSARERVRRCSICNMLTEEDPCPVCSDPARDGSILCVVEDAADVPVIERTREFRGRYHVLGGALSPLRGVGPEDIDIRGLLERVDGGIREVVVATDPNVEGEATALYLARLLKPRNVSVTRIAFGLPVGGDLEYADEVTMARSLMNRREI
ncbi:MAG TPA: recombination mediator RecR [Thermoanaerobaculia bacterium]|jgi:recombination protein RecR|nr:recombination mediator RecR [Thermoanaerobaculia bacterium]